MCFSTRLTPGHNSIHSTHVEGHINDASRPNYMGNVTVKQKWPCLTSPCLATSSWEGVYFVTPSSIDKLLADTRTPKRQKPKPRQNQPRQDRNRKREPRSSIGKAHSPCGLIAFLFFFSICSKQNRRKKEKRDEAYFEATDYSPSTSKATQHKDAPRPRRVFRKGKIPIWPVFQTPVEHLWVESIPLLCICR